MAESEIHIPFYKIVTDENGRHYCFFCELSGGRVVVDVPDCAADPDTEWKTVWETKGKAHFNQCHRCGKWVNDIMYNADVLECVDCAPWEEPPRYCSKCGGKIRRKDIYCPKCGARLQYGEVWT